MTDPNPWIPRDCPECARLRPLLAEFAAAAAEALDAFDALQLAGRDSLSGYRARARLRAAIARFEGLEVAR